MMLSKNVAQTNYLMNACCKLEGVPGVELCHAAAKNGTMSVYNYLYSRATEKHSFDLATLAFGLRGRDTATLRHLLERYIHILDRDGSLEIIKRDETRAIFTEYWNRLG